MQASRIVVCRNSSTLMIANRTAFTSIVPRSALVSARFVQTGSNQYSDRRNESMEEKITEKATHRLEKQGIDLGNEARKDFELGKEKVKEGVQQGKEAIKSAANQARDSFDKAKEAWEMGKEGDSLSKSAKDAAQNLGNKAAQAEETIARKASNMASSAKDAAKDLGNKAAKAEESLVDSAKDLGNKASNMASNAWEKTKEMANDAKEKGAEMLNNNKPDSATAESLKQKAGEATEKVKDAAQNISEKAKAGYEAGKQDVKDFGESVREGWNKSSSGSGSTAWATSSDKFTSASAGQVAGEGVSRMMWMGIIAACGALSYYAYRTYYTTPESQRIALSPKKLEEQSKKDLARDRKN